MISGTGGGTFVTQWSYDSADRALWQKYPGGAGGQVGEQVNFAYTGQGLLRQVQSNGSTYYVGETLYNALGQVTERWLGSTTGVVRQLYSYTAAENFRLVSMKAGNAPPYTNLQNITYGYDDVGNVLTITDAAAYGGIQTQTFTYDALHRLSTAQASGATGYGGYSQKSYGYDAIGNLTHFESTTQNQYYQDAAHKHAVTHIGGTAPGNQKYWYDQNGNATRRIAGTQDVTLSYDAENRLTGMSGGVISSYVYDGDGKRVKETSGGTTTVYIGNTFEWTGSTATMKSYYYAGGTRVAMRTGTSTGTVNYLLGDHLGSQALTLTSTGARLNTNTELRYYPYGVARYTAGTTPTTFNFTGQRKDSGSGLLFYNARWYDPVVGRFLQSDTLVPGAANPQALNRYSYTLNNPLRYTDPTGHWVETAFDVLSLGMTINDIRREGLTFWNAVSLVTDVASVALPIVPAGASHAIRAGKLASKAINAADTAADTAKLLNAADAAGDAAKLANKADNVADAAQLSQVPARQVTILGENMAGRVQPYAQATGARTLDLVSAQDWAKMSPKQRYHANDGALRKRIKEGDAFEYIGRDPLRPAGLREKFDLTGSELLRLEERGVPYRTVPRSQVRATIGRD